MPCAVEHAFDVFTARIDQWWPRGHRKWADSKLALSTEVGGRFVEQAADGQEHTLGEVLACVRPDHVRYTWFPGALTGPTEVEVRFSVQRGDTVVKVTHHPGQGPDAFEHRVALFKKSWPVVLSAYEELAGR